MYHKPVGRSLTGAQSEDAYNQVRSRDRSDHAVTSPSGSIPENPFDDTASENPFESPFDEPDDRHLMIPTIPGPQPRRFSGPRTSNVSDPRLGSRSATPSNGRYLSPYATPGGTPRASRRSSFASTSANSVNNTSSQDLFWTGRKDGPYAYEHDPHSSTDLNTQTVTEKFDIGPTTSLLWDPAYIEDDDDLHDPRVDNPKRDSNVWTKRGMINLGGLMTILLGLVVLFVAVPSITFWRARTQKCEGDSCLEVGSRALLQKPRTSLIDPDTPASAHTKQDASGNTLQLVFSDEFNQDGRTFYPGDDQFFEAKSLWYGATQDLEWYDPDAVTTKDGYLELRLDAYQNHDLNYRSGMIQSWNMLCFKGGLIEVSLQLPGAGAASGLWPAVWTMGNLGRPGYLATTDGMWPYSYQGCDSGITPNQSRTDGLSWLPGMRVPSCLCSSADAVGTGGHGRSSPEIDIIEGSVATLTDGTQNGVASQSYQIAPFDDFYQPNYDFAEVYNNTITTVNTYTGGPYQEAFSGITTLNNQWFEYPAATANQFQTYAFEYTPGQSASSAIQWYVGGEAVWKMAAASLGPNGNIGARTITEEPMAIVMNLGLSDSFAYIDWEALTFPSTLRVDYVRIYQSGTAILTCDPPGWETTDYISQHPNAYMDVNATSWEGAGYTKPKNKLMNVC